MTLLIQWCIPILNRLPHSHNNVGFRSSTQPTLQHYSSKPLLVSQASLPEYSTARMAVPQFLKTNEKEY
ncbi:MAG: hypothetical protein QNJ36_16955 [Calothrix sp. MO_167.B42]|nr:hypothetical protein [Calothrix sp. MO_167.B42]